MQSYTNIVWVRPEIRGDVGDRLFVQRNATQDHFVRRSKTWERLFGATAGPPRSLTQEGWRVPLDISTPELNGALARVDPSKVINRQVSKHLTKPRDCPRIVTRDAAALHRPHERGVKHVFCEFPSPEPRGDVREKFVTVASKQRARVNREFSFGAIRSQSFDPLIPTSVADAATSYTHHQSPQFPV